MLLCEINSNASTSEQEVLVSSRSHAASWSKASCLLFSSQRKCLLVSAIPSAEVLAASGSACVHKHLEKLCGV